MTMRAKRYRNSAARLSFMRRTTIPNSSFEQSFHPQSRDGTPHGLIPHLDVISSIILSEIEKSNQENVKFVFSKQVW